jgi:dephospho-CoA kinase
MKKPLRVGITGGIGSGKSLVCSALEAMGYPVYNSDLRARDLMESDSTIRKSLIEAFGPQAFAGETLNRSFLAEQVFRDPEKRRIINGIVHPVVRKDFARWADEQQSGIVFQESALLLETGGNRLLDYTVLVTAPVEERIRRVMQRDRIDEAAVRARIASQLSDEEKIPMADYVIENGSGSMVLPQINTLIDKLVLVGAQ